MKAIKLSPVEWSQYSDQAHLLCFNESNRSKIELIDYALMVVDDSKPVAYTTIRQLDLETCYMQYGGSFPETKGSAVSFRAYECILNELKKDNKFINTYIENTNTTMLRFAMKVGFKIVGIKTIQNKIYLEHNMEV